MNSPITIIISPSGNFYGSEQVLFDFLSETSNQYSVFVPQKGRLIEKLFSQAKHKVFPFQNVRFLYWRIFSLLLTRQVKTVYSNEGGHIRYLKLLANFFKGVKFVNHVRIIEDTQGGRIQKLPANVQLVSISRYITGLLDTVNQNKIRTIYDPYIPQSNIKEILAPGSDNIRIGIIGRVTPTKGLSEIMSFCDFLEERRIKNVEIVLFGDLDIQNPLVSTFSDKSGRYQYVRISFRGFVEEKRDIYTSIDVVVHLSKIEPLGRIFFESLDYGRPIIGFNKGGIGEIAAMLKIADCMIQDDSHWCENLYAKITHIQESLAEYTIAKKKYTEVFSSRAYCEALEGVIL